MTTNLGGEFTLDTTEVETELGKVRLSLDEPVREQAAFLDKQGHLGEKSQTRHRILD